MEPRSIKGTTTERNLMAAFAGESQDFARYKIYADAARAEGFEQIGSVFDSVALQELVHSRLLLNRLEGGDVTISATFPADATACTPANLNRARNIEHSQWSDIYASYASTALDEGFREIALLFKTISKAEINHEELFSDLIGRIESCEKPSRQPVDWICHSCGFSARGKKAPDECPLCGAGRQGFTALSRK